ncbi:Phenylacetate-coenzyme A ligase [Streptomyces sp. YIM 121038]|uniref:phenylacetate--CoA ligase family protein n=1 Tax=Streptomyces sp. YIM 121038 TaxID=2136401 RepID=UPI0011105DA1|nr:AMP-binding protein [Streptomyces sp. YIM 121038]QCX80808.1 Phenylacetate-coenzyme A ligase [Streptomyces sp. YIM 121038]
MTTPARAAGHDARDRLRDVLLARVDVARHVAEVTSFDRRALDSWVRRALAATVAHACDNSPFYAGFVPAHLVRAVADGGPGAFGALPFTTREHLSAAYPLGMLAVPRRDVIRFDESSGTGNGRPVAAFFTRRDWLENNLTVATLLSRVLDERDVAAIAVPYELAGVGQDLDRAIEVLGCTVVPLGAASPSCTPERMVDALHRSGATTLVCSGTRALYLGEIARRRGLDPRTDLTVSKILMAGEGASPAKKRRLADQWGATAYSMFGMTETNTLAMFCAHRELHLVETRTYFEIVDPASGEPLPDGSVGELALTTLASRAMPLLRYRTGDVCQIEAAPCACGSPLRRLRHRGRIGDRIRIGERGTSQLEIEDIVLGAMTRPPYYFAFHVDGGVLEIALPPQSADDDATRTAVADGVRDRLGAPARLRRLDVARFETALRTSAKPTMRTFSAHQEGG